MKEMITRLSIKSGLEEGTLYHFGKLGLLTGAEFWEAVLGTLDDAGYDVSKQTNIGENK